MFTPLLAGLLAATMQQTDTTVYRVGEIIVQATRPVTTTGGASALELKLDSLRINAAPTLDQILRQIPLMQVRVNSRGESQFFFGKAGEARLVQQSGALQSSLGGGFMLEIAGPRGLRKRDAAQECVGDRSRGYGR